MTTLLVGGNSSVARALKPALMNFSDVLTAGRSNCDIEIDLEWPLERFELPDRLDVIVQTAAKFEGKNIQQLLAIQNVNVIGTLKLCHAAFLAKASRFVLISSMYAALNDGSSFYGPYAESKRQAEMLAKLYCSQVKLPLTILRFSQIYGPDNSFRSHQPVLYAFADKAEMGEDILINGSNDARRNFMYIDDVAAIVAKTIQSAQTGTFECMFPVDVAFSEIAGAATKAFKSTGRVKFLRDGRDIPDNVFKFSDALYRVIGCKPTVSIDEGMWKIAEHRRALK